jgi:hypothetical protein
MIRRGRASVQAYEAQKQAEWEAVKPKPKAKSEAFACKQENFVTIWDNPATWIDRAINMVSSYGMQCGKISLDDAFSSPFHVEQRVTFPGGSGRIVGINGENNLGYSDIFPAGTLWIKEDNRQDGVFIPKDPQECRLEDEQFPSPQAISESPMLIPAGEPSSSEQTLAHVWEMVVLHNPKLSYHTDYTKRGEWHQENTFIIDMPIKIAKGLGYDVVIAISDALEQGAKYLLDNNVILVEPPVNLIPSDPFAVHIRFTTVPGGNLIPTT